MGSDSAAANTASLITVVPVSSTKLGIHDNFHMGFISDVVGRSPNLLPPSLPTALFLLLLHMGLGAQPEMRINKEVVLNLCFVMISLYRKGESRSLSGCL